MADGRDDRFARGPKRGHKLRYETDLGYVGGDPMMENAYLNENVKMSEDQRGNDVSSQELRDEGLILKQPLS